jgi:uncharacterized RDD family membrane protein YckC
LADQPPPQDTPGGYPPQPGYPPEPGYPTAYPPQPGYPPGAAYPGSYPPPPPGYVPGYPPYPGYGQPMGYPPAGYVAMPRFAGFWIRLGAYLLDVVIVVIASFVAFFAGATLTLVSPALFLVWIVVCYVAGICYQPFMWWKYGATLGQRAVGVRVVRDQDGGPISGGTAVIRFIGMILEGVLMFIVFIGLLGYVWAAFEPRKRAWHDLMAGTVVIHTD